MPNIQYFLQLASAFGRSAAIMLGLSVVLSLLVEGAVAETIPPHKVTEGASPIPEISSPLTADGGLEAFADGFMAAQFEAHDLAGGVLVIFDANGPILSKGYGMQDVDKSVAIDPDRSLFRIGSVTKLFTWTAVMQLVEKGQLDLDVDVNQYLTSFQIPNTFVEPITLRNLMTHTAGFEDGGLGYYFSKTPNNDQTAADALKKHLPKRVRPPETNFADNYAAAYSNHGAALAGVIVENVSGETLEGYFENHIFKPLGMKRATMREPLPENLSDGFPNNYRKKQGQFVEGDIYYSNLPGAGAVITTGADLAKFAIAHLRDGNYSGGRILSPDAAAYMHQRQLSQSPYTNGTALGFYETYVNGRRLIGHGGATSTHRTDLVLIPEAGIGYIISFNTIDGQKALTAFRKAFMDRYFPADLPVLSAPAPKEYSLKKYEGLYRSLRRPYSTFDKFLLSTNITVKDIGGGRLFIKNLDGTSHIWIEIKDGVFRQKDSDETIAFKTNASNRKTYLVGPRSIYSSEKMSWTDSSALHGWALAFAFLLFVVNVFRTVIFRRGHKASPPAVKLANWLSVAAAGGIFVSLSGLGFYLATQSALLGTTIPSGFKVFLGLLLLSLLLFLAQAFCVEESWRKGAGCIRSRLVLSVTTISLALAFIVLNYWNLIGFRFG